MPLTLATVGTTNMIRHIGGGPAVKQHLKDLGFVPGADVTVLTAIGDNIIVKVQQCRVAIQKEIAQKIMI